jgi:hypothetical protein
MDANELTRLRAQASVVTVGGGRGFVVNGAHESRLVVTAAHCLPFFPPCHGASYLEERTYRPLLAPLGKEPVVCAECLFADPIADIAVVGSPDEELWDEAEAYKALIESTSPIAIADAPEQGHGWVLSLEGKWFQCAIRYINDGPLWISNPEQPIVGGMSGSPVISDEGAAIGIVNLGGGASDLGYCNSRLLRDLPGRLLRARVPLTGK